MYTIQKLTDESDHNFSLVHHEDSTLHFNVSFDYAVPAETGDRDDRIVLYCERKGSVGDVRVSSIDESAEMIREIMA